MYKFAFALPYSYLLLLNFSNPIYKVDKNLAYEVELVPPHTHCVD